MFRDRQVNNTELTSTRSHERMARYDALDNVTRGFPSGNRIVRTPDLNPDLGQKVFRGGMQAEGRSTTESTSVSLRNRTLTDRV